MNRVIKIKQVTTEQDLSDREEKLRWAIGRISEAVERINRETLPELSTDEQYSPAKLIRDTSALVEEISRRVENAKVLIDEMQEGYRTLEFIERIEEELNR